MNVVIGTALQYHIEFSVGMRGAVIVITGAGIYYAGELQVFR